jgi:cell wall-associated protease
MASPMVTGLAALIMSYYPTLTPSQVKQVILQSATKFGDQLSYAGTGTEHETHGRFTDLSAAGGVINAYSALKLAAEMSGEK